MLIVNADDWGHSPEVTDATVACFDEEVVSSATAMVWMWDSARAADIARERRLPVGLHLNLTSPFAVHAVPRAVRERHLRVMEHFAPDSWQDSPPYAGDPLLLRDAVRDQLDRFYEELGAPTHIDGHHHVHVHEAVLDVLPPEIPVRSVPRPPERAGAPPSRRDERLRRDFAAPDLTVELHRLYPALRKGGRDVLRLARDGTVEIVVHAIEDLSRLRSRAWTEAAAPLRLGTYRELAARPPAPGRSAPSPPLAAPAAAAARGAPVAAAAEVRPCPICGSIQRRDYHDRRAAVCAGCGALERQRALARVLVGHDPGTPAPRCLEVGPRNGLVFGGWLRERGWRYEAVDKWSMRGRSDPDALGTYIDHDADLSDLHFAPSAAYHLFLLQHVLEEVRDYRSALDEIARILRPGGVAYLEIPWKAGQPASQMKPPDVYENIWTYGADLLDDLAARFEDVEVVELSEDRYRGDVFVCRQ